MAEYLCDNCDHKNVCKHKDMYEQFQDALENVSISVPGSDPNSYGVIRLKDVDWINSTKLDCHDFTYSSVKRTLPEGRYA